MTEQKLLELVQKIDLKTGFDKTNSLQWEKTARDEEFQTTLSKFVVRIRREVNDSEDDYILSIIEKDGSLLESVYAVALTRYVHSVEYQGPQIRPNPLEIMRRIYTNAKRHALGVDGAIDDILSELT